jgi:hypothetical protein
VELDKRALEDSSGAPLGDSTKAKMGLQAQLEEDMEYIGLSTKVLLPKLGLHALLLYLRMMPMTTCASSWCVVLKRSKVEVEEDRGWD